MLNCINKNTEYELENLIIFRFVKWHLLFSAKFALTNETDFATLTQAESKSGQIKVQVIS